MAIMELAIIGFFVIEVINYEKVADILGYDSLLGKFIIKKQRYHEIYTFR